MNRYFPIFHGLHPQAPWGVAVERSAGFPKVELLMLCRTEKDAVASANLTSMGHTLETFRTQQLVERHSNQRETDANTFTHHRNGSDGRSLTPLRKRRSRK